MEKLLENRLLEAAKVIEEQVDAAIEKLDNLEDEDLEAIQRNRAAALKKEMKMKEEWIANGHGEYTTFTSEKEFFEASKKSKNVVLHCYKNSTVRCPIVDKHLALLATKHIETKFCKIDVEKAPFLCDRLKIRVIPTIILCKDAKILDFIVGFDELGGVDDFSTEMMEWRLGKSGVINYDEDINTPPDSDFARRAEGFSIKHVKKNLRDRACGSDSDD